MKRFTVLSTAAVLVMLGRLDALQAQQTALSTQPPHDTSLPTVCADQVTGGNADWHRYEWRASTFALSTQHQAALAIKPDGQIVTVWSSRRQQSGRAGVYAQRFDSDGLPVGSETAVGLWSDAHQTRPSVAVDPHGNTWIAWESHGQDGEAGAIIARRFDPAFRGGSEILVNQQWRGHQSQPVVAIWPSGNAVIVWISQTGPGESARARGRMFGPDGQPIGDEFPVAASDPAVAQPPRTETTPSVACGPEGQFAVVYSVFDENMRPAGIRMRRFDAQAHPLGDEIVVAGGRGRSEIEPVIAAAADGYIVAWLDTHSDGDDYGVVARRFDHDGRPLGDPFVVNTTRQGPQNAAAIAVAPDGRFAIAWNSDDGDEAGVFAQLFSPDGAPLGRELRLNRHDSGKQAMHPAAGTQRLAFGIGGRLVCVWDGDAGLGDKSSVNVTMLSPQPLELAGCVQGVTDSMSPAGPVPTQLAGAEPHRPPTFDPRLIEYGEREIRREGRFGFDAILNTGWTPPDPHLAVGPEHLVAIVNGAIAFFEKDGTKIFQTPIEGSGGFWGSVGATDFVFDPEVLYDELSGRFFAMAAEAYAPPNQSRSYVLVAVSDDSDPSGTWYKYRFDTTGLAGNLLDSPNIAVDRDVVYITGDGFGISANYPVYTFDKASLLSGLPPAIQRSLTLPTTTQSAGPVPVGYDDPPALYMIEHQENPLWSNGVRLIALRDPLGSPYFNTYTLEVPQYRAPEDPPQLGTSVRPETFDARFWSVAYRNGSLWATHHVDRSRVRARWYEIAMNDWPVSGQNPALVQWGEIDLGGDIRTFFSAITVNQRGDALLTAARSSPNEYISMITAYRYANDPLGTFRTPVIEKASTGPYNHDRWGDYGGVGADPSAANVLWAHHEYCSNYSWRTWVARVVLSRGDLNCDDAVDFGDINPFVLALTNPAGYTAQFPNCDILNADINGDGLTDFGDINPFVRLLINP